MSSMQPSTQSHSEKKSRKMNILAKWRYQYEVTMGLYMLTPAEKVVINFTLLAMALLLGFAIYSSLPAHARLMLQRAGYYIKGTVKEITQNAKHNNTAKNVQDTIRGAAEVVEAAAATSAIRGGDL